MAIVINPALSGAASGNLGGICYASWRGLQIARKSHEWHGTHTLTPDQIYYKGLVETCASAWGQILSEDDREMWRLKARTEVAVSRLARRYQPSGYQLFMTRNVQRAVIGLPINLQPEVFTPTFLVTGIEASFGTVPGEMQVELTGYTSSNKPDFGKYWRAGPFDSEGKRAFPPDYRLVDIERPVAGFGDGTVIPGKFYWYKGCGGMDCGVVGGGHEVQAKAA